MLMAGAVGVMGGVINVLFYLSIEGAQDFFLRHPGEDIVQVAKLLTWPWRLLTPALGGLAAGGVLYWGVRLVGKQGSTNVLEVVVAGADPLNLTGELLGGRRVPAVRHRTVRYRDGVPADPVPTARSL